MPSGGFIMRLLNDLARHLGALASRLGTRFARCVVIGVATLFAATSVGRHRVLDDYVLALIARGKGAPVGLPRGAFDLFTFTTGDPAGNRRLMDVGLMLPWWTDPHLRISFFRPLTSFTHWLDERLWPSSAALMHLHSLFWFGALLVAASAVYVRLEASPALAGLALFLYAFDDTHGPAVAWLANRNALIAATFACWCLVAHDHWRRGRRPLWAGPAVLAFTVGLLAGELAIGALAYLVAYAALVDRDRPIRRALSIVPYLATIVTWRILWSRGGFGARGSGAYLDPLTDPLGFLLVLPGKLLVLLQGQFSGPPSDLAFLSPPSVQPALIGLSVVTALVLLVVFVPLVRRDVTSRFWALGMALSLVPLGATFPSDRLLVFVGLGAMALLARLFTVWIARAGSRGRLDFATVVVALLALRHVVLAPLLLPVRAAQMELFGVAHDRGAEGIPSGASIREKTVVVLAAPTLLFANYIQAERALTGVPRPAHLYVLASASSQIDVERTGPETLTLRPEHGFLYTPLERHYRGTAPFHVGDRVALSTMSATIGALGSDRRPSAVVFSFPEPAETYVFVKWRGDRFVPFALPPVGGHATLPEEDFGKILVETAMDAI